MKTIFYQQNQLALSKNNVPGFTQIYKHPEISELKAIVNLFLNSENFSGLIIGNESKTLINLKKYFKHIHAAGGLVVNNRGELLLIKRLGKWDLPKGKLEAGETKASGAVREVEEECGITGVVIVKKLDPSYHVYFDKNIWVLKSTHWFLMKYKGKEKLKPQAIENITEAIWVNPNDYLPKETETYPAITKVLRQSIFPLE